MMTRTHMFLGILILGILGILIFYRLSRKETMVQPSHDTKIFNSPAPRKKSSSSKNSHMYMFAGQIIGIPGPDEVYVEYTNRQGIVQQTIFKKKNHRLKLGQIVEVLENGAGAPVDVNYRKK